MNPIQNNIIKDLELDKLTPQEQEETLVRIGSVIYQNVLMRVLDTMEDKDQDEFEKLLDNNANSEEIFNFLNSKNKNFEQIISEESNK
ncbi:MAG: DUF5663 domain-containing protein [bacterium]